MIRYVIRYLKTRWKHMLLIPRTLLIRFMLIIILPSVVGQILAVFLFYDRHWYNVSYYTSNLIANEIKSLLENYETFDHSTSDLSTDIVNRQYLSLSYTFYKNSSLPKKQPKLGEELEILKNIIDVKIHKNNIIKLKEKKGIIISIELTNGVMEVIIPIKLLLNPTTYLFVLWLIFLTILLLSISLLFIRNQIRSILQLTNAAESFGRGVKIDYKPSGAYEIRKAGLAFLKMKDRIDKQFTKRTQMLAMISHDLRTPLTRIKLQIELMRESEETIALKQDIKIMTQIISSYLDFAKGEQGEDFRTVEICKWLSDFINTNYSSNNIELIYDKMIADCYRLQIKHFAFARAISNLIDNSIRYSTQIIISIIADQSNILIKIEDNGVGIKDDEKNLVFTAFYRSDHARSLSFSSNVGLGLAISKEIVKNHQGTISLSDSKILCGLCVNITLPSKLIN